MFRRLSTGKKDESTDNPEMAMALMKETPKATDGLNNSNTDDEVMSDNDSVNSDARSDKDE